VKRLLLFLVPAAVLAVALWYGAFGHRVLSGQPPLAAMDLAALRADFNRSAGSTRLIVLFSPT
jgi:hypothetical protein